MPGTGLPAAAPTLLAPHNSKQQGLQPARQHTQPPPYPLPLRTRRRSRQSPPHTPPHTPAPPPQRTSCPPWVSRLAAPCSGLGVPQRRPLRCAFSAAAPAAAAAGPSLAARAPGRCRFSRRLGLLRVAVGEGSAAARRRGGAKALCQHRGIVPTRLAVKSGPPAAALLLLLLFTCSTATPGSVRRIAQDTTDRIERCAHLSMAVPRCAPCRGLAGSPSL